MKQKIVTWHCKSCGQTFTTYNPVGSSIGQPYCPSCGMKQATIKFKGLPTALRLGFD